MKSFVEVSSNWTKLFLLLLIAIGINSEESSQTESKQHEENERTVA